MVLCQSLATYKLFNDYYVLLGLVRVYLRPKNEFEKNHLDPLRNHCAQYICGYDNLGGPPGCLQYFTGLSGSFASYNFDTTTTTVASTATHLSNQCYDFCFRTELGQCGICFVPKGVAFGLSATADGANNNLKSDTDVNSALCITDCLEIVGADPVITFEAGNVQTKAVSKLCGRFFNAENPASASSGSVCTSVQPFRVTFKADLNELTVGTAIKVAHTNEQQGVPGGITGFWIDFAQVTC